MNRPTGVTVIAVLYYIGAAFFICIGLAFLLGGGMMATMIADRTGLSRAVIGGMGIAIFIVMLCFAALHAVVGWGLMALKEWARIVAIVLAGLGALGGLFALIRISPLGLLRLALSGWMIWYLLQPHVVAAFQRQAGVPPPVPVR